jgi:hypothetical protein
MASNEDREAARLAMQAEAEAYAIANGMFADEGSQRLAPSPAELLGLLGGAEHASKALGNLPAHGGVNVVTHEEMAERSALMEDFWARGGGRFPAEFQPVKRVPAPRPRDDKFIRESLEDGFDWA